MSRSANQKHTISITNATPLHASENISMCSTIEFSAFTKNMTVSVSLELIYLLSGTVILLQQQQSREKSIVYKINVYFMLAHSFHFAQCTVFCRVDSN